MRIGAAVALLAALSFFWFPGHTILVSDTQIYIPILEHLADPNVLANDPMATRPHVSFTLYDEIALLVRRLTGSSFETILLAQQFVYRALGIWGVVLVCTGIGLSIWPALFVSAVASLGAAVIGPMVLTVEYEPVPRGFALPLMLLSLGLMAHSRWRWSAAAATASLAFHPPTALVFHGFLVAVLLWRKHWTSVAIAFAGPALILLSLAWGPAAESSFLFSKLDPALEKLQRFRANYNYVGIWFSIWWKMWAWQLAAALVGYWRLHRILSPEMRVFFLGLPLAGALSLPVSYLLLDVGKWAIIPQFQPGRYLLWITLFATLSCAIAAVRAPLWASFLLLLPPFAVPREFTGVYHVAPILVCAAIAAAAFKYPKLLPATTLAPFILFPLTLSPSPPPHHAELNALSSWARQSTPRDAVFYFANAGRQLPPGIFRARAVRALYVDWKAGGQVNFLPDFAHDWWNRWKTVEKPLPLSSYGQLGIDYVVFPARSAHPKESPVYSNDRWIVFKSGK